MASTSLTLSKDFPFGGKDPPHHHHPYGFPREAGHKPFTQAEILYRQKVVNEFLERNRQAVLNNEAQLTEWSKE